MANISETDAPDGMEASFAVKTEAVVSKLELVARASVALTKAGALPTAAGAFIVFCYFVQAGHVPSLGLPDLLVFFIASAGTGTLLLVSLALLPWALGFLWSEALNVEFGQERRSLRKTFVKSVPFALLTLVLPAALSVTVLLLQVSLELSRTEKLYLWMTTIVISFGATLVWSAEHESRWHRVGRSAFVAAVAGFGNLVALIALWAWLIVARQQLASEDDWTQLIALLFIGLVIVAVAAIVMFARVEGMWPHPDQQRAHRRWSAILVPIGSVLLLFSISGFGNVNRSIVRALGIGGLTDVSLVIDEKGRDQLAALGYRCASSTEAGPCVIRGATVHLTLGDELLVEVPQDSAGKTPGESGAAETGSVSRRLTLSKARVDIVERPFGR